MKNPNLLIDGSNLLYRVYWVSRNSPANVPHLFLNSLKKLHNDWNPNSVYIAWDSKLRPEVKSFRRVDEDYKGTRDKSQWEKVYEHEQMLREMCKCIGVHNIHPGSLEADDVLYYLTKQLEGDNIVITSDHDLLQVINNSTCVYNPVSKTMYSIENFTDLIPVPVDLYIHYKALIGDKSDNISGIKGVGPKTAVKIINEGIEATLTAEQLKTYHDNLNLVDLSRGFTFHPDEEQIYEYQLKQSQDEDATDRSRFRELCEEIDYPDKSISKFDVFFENEINKILLDILK